MLNPDVLCAYIYLSRLGGDLGWVTPETPKLLEENT
jgi:hypothetical protein